MFKLPIIDFSKSSFLDGETAEFHYGKHHKFYIDKLNELTKSDSSSGLISIMEKSTGELKNYASQSFNHTFYWLSLTPSPSSLQIDSKLLLQIIKNYGGLENLKNQFLKLGASVFGSGWTWLCINKKTEQLTLLNTENAGTPCFETYTPLLVCDLWEHAYYIDYRNSRTNYLKDFWNAINWRFVSENYETRNINRIEKLMT